MAYTKPTKIPRWADTSINIVEPSEGKKDEGWLTNEIPPSSYQNWLENTEGNWWKWLDERWEDGATNEEMKVKFPIINDISGVAATNVNAVYMIGKGAGNGVVGLGEGASGVGNIGAGIYGIGASTGTRIGVFGKGGASGGRGMSGVGQGANAGVWGGSSAYYGIEGLGASGFAAVYGRGAASGADSHGVHGKAVTSSSYGIYGESTNSIAVYGLGSSGNAAVYGLGATSGTSSHGIEGLATQSSSYGVRGKSEGSYGIVGLADVDAYAGVRGVTILGHNGYGVEGEARGNGYAGVRGLGAAGTDASGILGLGDGDGVGIVGFGDGVSWTGPSSSYYGAGVVGVGRASGDGGGYGVYGKGNGDFNGVYAEGTSTRAALRIKDVTSDPGAASIRGDLIVTGAGHPAGAGKLRIYTGAAWVTVGTQT